MTALDQEIHKRQDNVLAVIMMVTAFLSIIPQYTLVSEVILAVYMFGLTLVTTVFALITAINIMTLIYESMMKGAVLNHCSNYSYYQCKVPTSCISEYMVRYKFHRRTVYFYLKWILILILFESMLFYGTWPLVLFNIGGLVVHEILKYYLYKEFMKLYIKISPLGYSKHLEADTIYENHRTDIYPNMWKAYILL